jgi:transposase-like protein
MAKHKKWSAQAKLKIALEAFKGDKTINEICKAYNVAPSQVHEWKKQLLGKGDEIFSKKSKDSGKATKENSLDAKVEKLHAKIGELTMERDYLKKVWGKYQGIDDDS